MPSETDRATLREIGRGSPGSSARLSGPGIIYRMLALPLPVTDVRDGWDWLVIWCTVGASILALAAIFFAAYAIRRTNLIAREGQQAIAQERRNVFELGLLARLVDISGHNQPGAVEAVAGLLRMLPSDDLPGLRRENEQGTW